MLLQWGKCCCKEVNVIVKM